MARQAGEVLERRWKRGRGYALRFHAYGERRYLTLGFERDGWTRRRAEEELQNVMADVRRGLWVPPKKSDPKPKEEVREGPPLFGEFAIGLHEARKGETSESNHEFTGWCLRHAVPYFGDWPLDEIDIAAVDEFRRHLRLFVRRSKTAAGLREIHLLPLLRDELAKQKMRAEKTGPDDPAFPTSAGGRRDKDNLRNRVLELSVRRADELLQARDRPPLPAD